MKRMMSIAVGALVACAVCAATVTGLSPELLSVTFSHQDNPGVANTNIYSSGGSLLLSNCYVVVDSAITQDLTDVFVVIRVGNENTNYTYQATTVDAAKGHFKCIVTIPPHAELNVPVEVDTPVRIQCTLTNTAGVRVRYRGDKIITVRSGLLY